MPNLAKILKQQFLQNIYLPWHYILPESRLEEILKEEGITYRNLPEHQWCGLRVRVCDGTTILMSDSNDNQAVYPQHGNQAAGCGFPLLKLVVIFSLVTGAVAAVCIAPWCTSEIVMSRMLYEFLSIGDVLLADRAYGNYVDLAMIQEQGAHGVFRFTTIETQSSRTPSCQTKTEIFSSNEAISLFPES